MNLFKSYLNNRGQYIEFENVKSDIFSIGNGVLQGSILGPLLFIIHRHNFPKASKMFNFIMHADDTTLFSTIKSFNDNIPNKNTESAVNDELLKIMEWLTINKLSLNKNKSKYVTFQMSNRIKHIFSLNINHINIERVEKRIFLTNLS